LNLMRLAPPKGETVSATVPSLLRLERFCFLVLVLTQPSMSQKNFRVLVTWLLSSALLSPSVIARANSAGPAPAEGTLHVDVTYTEEAHIIDKAKNDNGAERTDVSNFSFRATAGFEQRVMMQTIAGTGVTFYAPADASPKYSGAVSYNGEVKRTGTDEKHRPSLDEVSQINFAGVLSEDSEAGVPDDNAAGIQFGIQANLPGECKGKRTFTSFIPKPGGEEKKFETTEINSCGYSDESHTAALITRAPLNADLRQLANGKEVVHYAAQFHVTSCNLNPQYCVELKAAEAAASAGPDSVAMSDNWIGANTSGNLAAGFKINLMMFKELKVEGTWKRYLQIAAAVTPVTRSRAAWAGETRGGFEVADRLRSWLI
jgi:hypothetical protein